MPEMTTATPGVFNWIDLSSPDVDASVAFYGAVFGWEAEDQFDTDGETRVYVMLTKDGRNVAGLGGQMEGMQGMPAIWHSYIATEDADKTLELVESNGGTVVAPVMDIYEDGRMAVCQAPDGAHFSIWQPKAHIGAQLVNEPDTWTWNELMTRDLDAARPFYAAVFGWTYGEMDMGAGGTYYLAQVTEDQPMGGLMAMPDEMPDQVPNHWLVYIDVADLDETLARVTAAGGSIASPPMDAGVGTTAIIHDPHGGSFAVMQPHQRAG